MSPELGDDVNRAAEVVRIAAVEMLGELVPEEIAGYRVSRGMLLDVLVYAAAEGTSLHGACAMLEGVADDNTLRDYLNAVFPAGSVFDLNRRIKSVIMGSVPKAVFARRQQIAIDTKDFPYYGHHPDLDVLVCRGRARQGTTRFLRIATAYVMHDGQRVTLSTIQVTAGMRQSEIVRDLVGHLRFFGVKIESMYLDRGFASVDVIRAIKQMNIPAVIACPNRGSASSGVKQFCKGRASHSAFHTFNSTTDGAASVPLAVVRSFVGGRRTRKRGRWFVYIVIGRPRAPKVVHSAYRYRFGVETSYRILNQIRPRTTSRNPAIRLLMTLIGVLLANLWVRIKRQICRRLLPPRGFRRSSIEVFDDHYFRMARLKSVLRHAIERRYGIRLFAHPSPLIQ